MSKFYGDLLRDFNDSYSTGFYGGYPVILKFKTKPSEKVSLQQTYRIHRDTVHEGEKEVVEHHVQNGVTLKTECGNTVNSKFKFTNEAATYEVAYKPKNVNVNGQSLTLKHNSTFGANTKVVASTESVKFGAPLFGDAKLGVTLDYNWQTGSNKQTLKASANVTQGDVNVGVKTDYSVDGKQTKSLLAQAAYNTAKVNHFLVADIFSRQITYATLSTAAYKANETHACDIVVDGNRKLKGFFGQPLTTSWAGIYRLNPESTLRVKLFLGQEWNLGFAWGQLVNKNLEVNFSHDLNLTQVKAGKAEAGVHPYNFGVALKWRI